MTQTNQIADAQLLTQFSQMFRTLTDTFLDRAGIHRGQGMLLCTIVRQDGMTQSELADLLSVQGATITNMLQRMEEAGLVNRRRDPEDNRLVRVYVTDEGRRKEEAISQELGNLNQTIFKGLSEADLAALRRLLGRLIENMGGE